jgi:plastocyanin
MKKLVALLVLVLAAVALVACGSSSSSSNSTSSESTETTATSGGGESSGAAAPESESESGGGSSTLKIAAQSGTELSYTSKTATAKAGKVKLEFENPQELQHDVAIEDSSGKTIGKTELVSGGTASTTVELKPGTYHYFCTVPGHREAGMEGTLTVK